jgi:hypothetical protein
MLTRAVKERRWALSCVHGGPYLVDSGAIHSMARRKGVAVVHCGDRVRGADVIFGEEGDSQLLGAFTLEALGLSLDPLRRELRPMPMVLAVQTVRA